MVARVQRVFTLCLLLVAILVGVWVWRAGHKAWAVPAALAVFWLHAWVLALEFGLMAAVNRSDPAPRATLMQLIRAWWGEVLAAAQVFTWRQPFCSQAEADHLQARHQGQRGVVLVHGFACNRGLWNPWLRQLRQRDRSCLAVTLEPLSPTLAASPNADAPSFSVTGRSLASF